MFVCVCFGITDKQIAQAVKQQGVGNIGELKRTLGVGSQCGSCIHIAQQIIDQTIVDEAMFKDVG